MQIATSILLGCELWNTSRVFAWTTPPRQRAPSLRGVRPSLSLSLGWAAAMWPKLSWSGRGHGVGQSLARSLGKEPACFPKKQWAGVRACALALAKLPVWALTFYTTSLPKFINLHWVCWTVWAKKRPWKGWCTAFWHFPHATFWFLGLKRVLTKSTSVWFSNV